MTEVESCLHMYSLDANKNQSKNREFRDIKNFSFYGAQLHIAVLNIMQYIYIHI